MSHSLDSNKGMADVQKNHLRSGIDSLLLMTALVKRTSNSRATLKNSDTP